MIDQVDFHDGYVDGLLTSDSVARIFLRSIAGEKFTLTLSGVEAFRADNFRQGNIILEAKVLTLDQLDASFVFETYDYSDELRKGFSLRHWAEQRKGLQVLEITPSYGCSISAVFKSYALVRESVRA